MKYLYDLLLRLGLSAAGLALASTLFKGIRFDSVPTLIWAAVLLAVANTIVRPVLVIFTLPATILTLGLFLLVINAAILGLVAWMLPGFALNGFWDALGAWACVAFMQGIGNMILGRSRLVVRVERRGPGDFR
jgi:putative membrane protein